jgi:hypothetical protein
MYMYTYLYICVFTYNCTWLKTIRKGHKNSIHVHPRDQDGLSCMIIMLYDNDVDDDDDNDDDDDDDDNNDNDDDNNDDDDDNDDDGDDDGDNDDVYLNKIKHMNHKTLNDEFCVYSYTCIFIYMNKYMYIYT